MTNVEWTDERTETLKKLWMDGLSASQIALELGEGLTRNAVIGKVHRLKLKPRAKINSTPRPPKPRRERVIKMKPPVPKRPDDRPPYLEIPGMEIAPPPKVAAFDALPGSTPVKVEHHKTGCKWPIGDPACFCNEPLKVLKPATDVTKPVYHHAYCEAHATAAVSRIKKAS